MEIGLKHREEITVTPDKSAKIIGSGNVDVFGTPAMIGLMEYTAARCVAPYLPEGKTTVGCKVHIDHSSPTPIGMRVWCEVEVVEADDKFIEFNVAVWDECGEVGSGTHERAVIDFEKFTAKTNGKLKK